MKKPHVTLKDKPVRPALAGLLEAQASELTDPRAPVMASARQARKIWAELARTDASVFNRFVLRDEKTGARIKQAPLHEKWHRLMDEHDRLIFISHVEAGKTNQIAIGRALWEIGKDPSLRVAIVSNTGDLAQKMTRQIAQYVEKSEELHLVFPHLLPTDDPSLPWKGKALTMRRPGIGAKDPTIQACGVHGNITGSRIDLLILDDILDMENTATPSPRDDVYTWVKSTLFGRLTEEARIWIVGNAWHPNDLLHRLEREPLFKTYRFPVEDQMGNLTWPEKWSRERIEKAKLDMGPLEFSRSLMCMARDDTSSRFKQEWLDACLALGEGMNCAETLQDLIDWGEVELPEEWDEDAETMRAATESLGRLGGGFPYAVFTGVDLAVQRHASADQTCLFTIMVDGKGRRRVLNIQAGKWTAPEILDRIEKTYEAFGSMFMVENNAAQHYIVQLAQQKNIPVVPFTTGRQKAHHEFGIEGLGAELAAERWVIPAKGKKPANTEVAEWIRELLFYDPREHVGDRVMASWFAREAARRFADGRKGAGSVGVRVF